LTHAEVAKLAAETGPYAVLIRTLAYTGLRWGEATALRVRDVDLDRRRLDVRRAFVDISGKLVEGTPKTHQSRSVPLPPSLCAELRDAIEGRDRDALVFVSPEGTPLRIANFRTRAWIRAVRAAGLDGLTIHGLRHTAASLYISACTPPKVVQRILGHGSVTITMDLYGHLYPDEMDTWASRLDDIAGRESMWPERGQFEDEGMPNGDGQ
jgi:integrase